MRTGIFLNYAGGFLEAVDQVVELEKVGVDIALVAEAYSYDAISQLGFLAAKTSTHRTRHRRRADLHPHPDAAGDDGRGPRLRLRRPLPVGHRHVRAAGDGGLPRRAVRRSAGPHPRGRRHLQAGVATRAGHLRRQVLPGTPSRRPRHRSGQAAAADQSSCPGTHSDHHRGAGPEERRADRGDRRGLAAGVLLPREGRRGVGRRAAGRARQA